MKKILKRLAILTFMAIVSSLPLDVYGYTWDPTVVDVKEPPIGAVQTWTVPADRAGRYTLAAWGSQGGNTSYSSGGNGAKVVLDYDLYPGDVVTSFANGQAGYGGGGDGAWIKVNGNLVVVAGGGGGGGAYPPQGRGRNGKPGGYNATSGDPSSHSYSAGCNGGSAGSGGGNGGPGYCNAGGAGINTGARGGVPYVRTSPYDLFTTGGGGGGYSGGGGGGWDYIVPYAYGFGGGGGGSFVAGSNYSGGGSEITPGDRSGNGGIALIRHKTLTAPGGLDAQFVSLDTGMNSIYGLQPGQIRLWKGFVGGFKITVKNTGFYKWPKGQHIELIANPDTGSFTSTWVRDNADPARRAALKALPCDVNPGQTFSFDCDMVYASVLNYGTLKFKMIWQGVTWFGPVILDKTNSIFIADPITATEYISDTIPTTMEAGEIYNFNIVLKNIFSIPLVRWVTLGPGFTPYPSYIGTACEYHMRNGTDILLDEYGGGYTQGPYSDIPNDGKLVSEPIPVGKDGTYNFNVTAPSSIGTKIFASQLVCEHRSWDSPVVTKTITVVDTKGPTAPIVTVTPKNAAGWSTPKATMVASGSVDKGVGVDKYQYSKDNGVTWQDGDTQEVIDEGTTKILFRAVDKVGNISPSTEGVANVDKTPPIISADPESGVLTAAGVNIDCDDDNGIDKVYYRWDLGSLVTVKPYNSTINTSVANTAIAHVLKVTAQDLAGNETSVTFNYDPSAASSIDVMSFTDRVTGKNKRITNITDNRRYNWYYPKDNVMEGLTFKSTSSDTEARLKFNLNPSGTGHNSEVKITSIDVAAVRLKATKASIPYSNKVVNLNAGTIALKIDPLPANQYIEVYIEYNFEKKDPKKKWTNKILNNTVEISTDSVPSKVKSIDWPLNLTDIKVKKQ
jgi:hypothetical protein